VKNPSLPSPLKKRGGILTYNIYPKLSMGNLFNSVFWDKCDMKILLLQSGWLFFSKCDMKILPFFSKGREGRGSYI